MTTNENTNNMEETLEVSSDINEKRLNWAGFVETTVVNFFVECKLEKLNIEDGKGNKAKLARQKDDTIKVEYTSTTTL
ncbi:MAG TPA: hypothetical protein PK566_09180 [Pseudobacteroides sp.]|nr:hypothetical protein [Pseudobacteroides sp.]